MPIGKFFEGFAGELRCDDGANDAVSEALSTPDGVRMAALFARIKSPKVRRKVVDLTEAVAGE